MRMYMSSTAAKVPKEMYGSEPQSVYCSRPAMPPLIDRRTSSFVWLARIHLKLL